MELLKLISTNEIIAQIVSFLIIFFLLRHFLWGRLLTVLDARKKKIASELNNIEETKSQLAGIKHDYEQRISSIDEEARRRIQEAVEQGRKLTEEMRKKAHESAQDIIDNARANIKYELSKAKEELKEQIIDLSLKAAENVIQEKLTEEDDRKIVEDFLARIDETENEG